MKLSVILISYNMAREIPRTLQGLSRPYQEGAKELDYEVILVDNGSPEPLDASTWAHIDVPVTLIQLTNASHSPAHAINVGLEVASGEVVCLMIDGAHLLTPGVFRLALGGIGMFESNCLFMNRTLFDQIGGTTTNVTPEQRDAKVEEFMAEYKQISGHGKLMSDKPSHFIGHLPSEASKIHRPRRLDHAVAMRSVGLRHK